jgi:salicylate hydroxylase
MSSLFMPVCVYFNIFRCFQKEHLYDSRQASLPLHIIIVGCGLGGLAAAHCLAQSGHKITILEAASKIGEVGTGIQVSPNLSRLLIRWGLGPQLEKLAVAPEGCQLLRYSTGERIWFTTWGKSIEREFGAPYYHIHGADLHSLIYDLVAPLENVELRLGSTVAGVQPGDTDLFTDPKPSIALGNGETIAGDLIIGADGIKSLVQTVVLGEKNLVNLKPIGDAAYCAILPTSILLEDPELRPLVEYPTMTAWMTPGRHLLGYNIVSWINNFTSMMMLIVIQRAKQQYNLVLIHPDDGSVEPYATKDDIIKMINGSDEFEPRYFS